MRLRSLKFSIFLLLCCFHLVSAQFVVPKKPSIIYPVYDEVGLLSQQEKNELNNKLIKFQDSTSVEILVAIIPTTNGEDINFAATMLGEKWGIGEKGQDNGFVFLIAKNDRKVSIQQGRGAEQYMTASVAGQITDYIVTPNFKQGLWYEGINRGTTAIMETVQGKFKPIVSDNEYGGEVSLFKIILIAFVILIILSFLFKNRGGGGGSSNDDDDVIISRRGSRNYPGGFFPMPGSFGGGSFGGGSGGGFGGFGGGGSFGGGGASGSW